MKKLVSFLVVAAMLLGLMPMVFAAEGEVIHSQTDLALTAETGAYGDVVADVYEFTWIAPANGIVTVNVTKATPGVQFTFGESLPTNVKGSGSEVFEVIAGREYLFAIRGYANWSDCAARTSFELVFTESEGGETVKEEYVLDETVFTQTGVYEVALMESAYTTVYEFRTMEPATYTFTVPEGYLVGCWGYSSAFMWDVTGDGKTNTFEHTVTAAEQPVMIGITGEGATTLTITKGEAYIETVYNEVVYENKQELTPYVLPEDAVLGDYVDVYGVTHTAVAGDDGYYHLDSADGDILLVDMDYLYVLSNALKTETGRNVMYVYEQVDEHTYNKYNIGEAVKAYEAVCDANGYYPLTDDLIYFYKNYGESNGVYSFALEAGYNPDCVWMYACRTLVVPKDEPAAEGTGTFEDPYIIHSLPYELSMTVPSGTSGDQYYVYTAEKDGFIEIKDANDDYNAGSIFMFINNWMDIDDEDLLWDLDRIILNDYPNYEVKQGDKILINYFQPNYMPNPWELDAVIQYVETSADEPGGDIGGEDPEDPEDPDEPDQPAVPDSGDWTGTNVAVAADEVIEIVFTPEVDGLLEVAVSCETGWQVVLAFDSEEESFWSDYHTGPVTYELTAGTTYTIQILPYDQADGWNTCDAVMTYSITFNGAGQPGGDEEEFPTLVIGDNYLELPMEADSVSYEFVATETGTLHFIFTYIGIDMMGDGEYSDDTDCLAEDIRDFAPLYVNGEIPAYYYFGSIDVVAGESYVFEWVDNAEYVDWGWDATLNLSYSDELLPKVGTEELPIALHVDDCPTNSVEIPAGQRVHYQLEGFMGQNLIIKGTGAYAVVTTTVYDEITGAAKQVEKKFTAVNGAVTVPVGGYYFNVQIGNSGSENAVFELDAEYPLGSFENPDKLTLGTKKVKLAEENNGYLLVWEAERDGVLTIEIGGNYWVYCVTNITTDESDGWHNWADADAVSTQVLTVKKGDVIWVEVTTFKSEAEAAPADTVTIKTSFKADVNGDVMLGDANGDGEVNNIDAMLILQYTVGIIDESQLNLDAADVNYDGSINNIDAMLILQYTVGIITEFKKQ